ncbi:MFS transporter [Rhizobium sp. B230/85]|nr:MFS transporter [Rhizobium sp. L58/93]MBO9136922.1 MFS transporter [Rhizobium sp. B209b/85]MBO9172330.1 MFS transporter [Rhizobium sp. L245/93]MBO9186509.1 MFS transporter [Rhizobium sp. E27B/91]QXZ86102.1 MFS transporter [Rhizobium sp. K1/93]QXZ92442.1 MFS transporter [Rhizobium sp. K15/93]QXZ98695.1 MFS transporter [Rhizobium sp. B230/85]QYA04337.1 MFS transporter [Rhizobium sp. B21/90]
MLERGLLTYFAPSQHPRVSQSELDYIKSRGALTDVGAKPAADAPPPLATRQAIKQILTNRMLVGIFLAQYCIASLSTFFISWFPSYLVEARHFSMLHAGFVASLPAIFGCIGGVTTGFFSDWLLRRDRIAEPCPQNTDHTRARTECEHHPLQLHRGEFHRRGDHVRSVLRKGVRGTWLDSRGRHRAKRGDRTDRGAVQRSGQRGGHYHSRCHRLHHPGHRLVPRSSALRRNSCDLRCGQLLTAGRPHRTFRAFTAAAHIGCRGQKGIVGRCPVEDLGFVLKGRP